MAIEKAIVTLLGTVAAATVGDRIAAAVVPQSLARPNLVYQRIDGRGITANDGPTGVRQCTMQVTCFADDYAEAKKVAELLTTPATDPTTPGIDGFSGTVGTVRIHSLFVVDERDAPGVAEGGKETGVPGVVLTLAIAYSG